MSNEQQPLSNQYRVPQEVSDASLAKMVEIGLENDRDGGAARMLLQNRPHLREKHHVCRNGSHDIYWEVEESRFDFSGEWHPKVKYRTESTRKGVKVHVIEDDISGFRVVNTTADPDKWNKRHPKQARAVRESLRRVISASESPGNPLRVIPDMRAIKESAHEQQERYARKGNSLLRKVRWLLNGIVHIGLDSLDTEVPDIPSGYRPVAYPTQTTEDEAFQENRRRIAEQHSAVFLFRCEMERLWHFIMWRQEAEWDLASIVASAGIGPKVAKRYEKVLFSMYRDLRSVDEDIIRSSSLEIACTFAEAKIIEADRLPTVEEIIPDIGQAHHNRTIWIGKTLRHFEEDNERLPLVKTYSELSEWLATHVPEQIDVPTVGRTRYRDALKATGCWCGTSSGKTEGLIETMQNAIHYAESNFEKGERG